MSMHLVGPYLTTTNYKKRKEKVTKTLQEELERSWRERNERLKKMGLPKETYEQYLDWVYGRGKKEKTKATGNAKSKTPFTTPSLSNYKKNESNPSSKAIVASDNKDQSRFLVPNGGCTKKPSPTYTGKNMLGVATMHKSNMVPVFSTEDAEAISKMRR